MVAPPSIHADLDRPHGKVRGRWLRWLLAGTRGVFLTILLAWAAGAIYFAAPVPGFAARLVLAVMFTAFGIWSLWFARDRRLMLAFAVLYGGLLIWWSSILPSHDRQWRPDHAVLPQAIIEGDRVRISDVRNFDYRTRDDFDVRYETREVALSHLTGIDFYISYWMQGPVAHTFLSFTFDNAPPLAISIEARFEAHEGFDPLASLFKQFELIYVVGEERDVVRVRTNIRKEDVYLFHINVSPEAARRLFLVYLERINQVHAHAEFYHLLSNNCTINIVRYANRAGREGWFEIRHLLNGLIDGYLYNTNRLDSDLPLPELRARSHINEAAQAADDSSDFSERIRAELPPRVSRP
ncbi:MAG TPA: DUF4105 domain-containing protein [Povalibacter sp.]|nr:DUF4105 domain-containing protein [Povalibacter sp.]